MDISSCVEVVKRDCHLTAALKSVTVDGFNCRGSRWVGGLKGFEDGSLDPFRGGDRAEPTDLDVGRFAKFRGSEWTLTTKKRVEVLLASEVCSSSVSAGSGDESTLVVVLMLDAGVRGGVRYDIRFFLVRRPGRKEGRALGSIEARCLCTEAGDIFGVGVTERFVSAEEAMSRGTGRECVGNLEES